MLLQRQNYAPSERYKSAPPGPAKILCKNKSPSILLRWAMDPQTRQL